jgi:hypothetical protein
VDARSECGHDDAVDRVNHPFASLHYDVEVRSGD